MSRLFTHIIVLASHEFYKCGYGYFCMNCVNEIGKFLDKTHLQMTKARITCPILTDRRINILDVTPVAVAKHVRGCIIAEWPIDHIAFKAIKTNACIISIEGFVCRPVESIL